jgi:hypothetical protein
MNDNSELNFKRLNAKRAELLTENTSVLILDINLKVLKVLKVLTLKELTGKRLLVSRNESEVTFELVAPLGLVPNADQPNNREICQIKDQNFEFQIDVIDEEGFKPHWKEEIHHIFRNGKPLRPLNSFLDLVNNHLISFNRVHLYVTNTPESFNTCVLYAEINADDRLWIESNRLIMRDIRLPHLPDTRLLLPIESEILSKFFERLYNCPRGDSDVEHYPSSPTGEANTICRRLSFLKIPLRMYLF